VNRGKIQWFDMLAIAWLIFGDSWWHDKKQKTTIKGVGLIDLQLKLAKHPNWQIL